MGCVMRPPKPAVPGKMRSSRAVVSVIVSLLIPIISGCNSAPMTITAVRGESWPSIELFQISCPAVGGCVAVGNDRAGANIVVEQRGRHWGSPVAFGPKPADNQIQAVSCSQPGACIASSSTEPLLLISQSSGRWGNAHRVSIPGSAFASASASECSPNGPCWSIVQADGSYALGENEGHWLHPFRLGERMLNGDRQVLPIVVTAISCWTASSCTVAGEWPSARPVPFVQTESAGRWRHATLVPGTGSIGGFSPNALTCTARGTCLLGGYAGNPRATTVGAVEQEVSGRWRVPTIGIGATATPRRSYVYKVSCHSLNLCVAAGISFPKDAESIFSQAEVGGHWLEPLLIETGAKLSHPFYPLIATSCPTVSRCDVVGDITTTDHRQRSFEASYTASGWRYKIINLGNSRDQTEVSGMSCVKGRCWVAVDVFTESGVPIKGAVFPLT